MGHCALHFQAFKDRVLCFGPMPFFSFSYCLLEVMSSVPCTLGVLPSLLQVHQDVAESKLLLCLAQAMMMDGKARDKDVEEGKVASQLTRSDVSTSPDVLLMSHKHP